MRDGAPATNPAAVVRRPGVPAKEAAPDIHPGRRPASS
ncbi:MAG: hypothetical protein AVDCRST_MAG52-3650 [uncultured Blastococcus sp.]|uniref:Uncharacterized protein n=1 Tax=uncultured Blastococcus sp. TaxID=217144 RepID=A0A6J4J8T5_9ACTN|nr:MAG: hypothetical protein AVDCRST_MAG52-3650 [uncultured Blastococcus sp.]